MSNSYPPSYLYSGSRQSVLFLPQQEEQYRIDTVAPIQLSFLFFPLLYS